MRNVLNHFKLVMKLKTVSISLSKNYPAFLFIREKKIPIYYNYIFE